MSNFTKIRNKMQQKIKQLHGFRIYGKVRQRQIMELKIIKLLSFFPAALFP